MTWKQRLTANLCTYPNCTRDPLPDRDECRLHWFMALDRKRYWWTYRRYYRRPKQLCLVLESR
jgi:hypothetical protein